mmetsp:Transcript_18182/g.41053  ORF Transcript_18182/g.41053 Transcript_18182/m.41053 type:complete len:273 (-) Transcript_18182:9-827(-)
MAGLLSSRRTAARRLRASAARRHPGSTSPAHGNHTRSVPQDVPLSRQRVPSRPFPATALLVGLLSQSASGQTTCLGSFGASVGDPVCCGRLGTISSADEVCPEAFPLCVPPASGSGLGACRAISLEPPAGSAPLGPRLIYNGADAWSDRAFIYSGIPTEMLGAVSFVGSLREMPAGNVTLTSPVSGTLYAWSEARRTPRGCEEFWELRTGGLDALGWDDFGTMGWGNAGGPCGTMWIYSRPVEAETPATFFVEGPWAGGAAFQPLACPACTA